MVQVYLEIDGTTLPFLSIPNCDIQRLTIRPFKWLRFVMFSICGARGELHAMSDDSVVDYDNTTLSNDIYYKPREDFIFVDHRGLNEHITTSTLTLRRHNFRDEILERDGPFCVITGLDSEHCVAAHLVPKSKGHDYVLTLFNDRSTRYNSPSPISGVNAIENGVLLSKNLHSMLAHGSVAFIKTPNFGLEAVDLVRVNRGSTGTEHITLQHLKAPTDFDSAFLLSLVTASAPPRFLFEAGANLDILFQGTGTSPPSHVILDYMYGVAAFKRWGVKASQELLQKVYESHYKPLLAAQPAPDPHSGDDDTDSVDEGGGGDDSDDSRDADYDPDTSQQQHYASVRRGDEMAKAMDDLNAVIMYLKGTSPQEAAARWEKRMEEEEEIARKASRNKVMEWMKAGEVGGLSNNSLSRFPKLKTHSIRFDPSVTGS